MLLNSDYSNHINPHLIKIIDGSSQFHYESSVSEQGIYWFTVPTHLIIRMIVYHLADRKYTQRSRFEEGR